jgi:geranylgeranyl diphosphate synthase, type I
MTATLPPEALTRCRDEVLPALRATVARLDPLSRAATSYHLGWTEADGAPRTGGAGKSVRAALTLLSAELAGAPAAAGLPGAVAVELVHNFSLLQDDVMDGDTERRHRPTVWLLWGKSNAVLVGDALLALAAEVLLESGAPTAPAATVELLAATRELVRGQLADLAFESRTEVGLDECLDMADGKTAALLAASTAVGALLGGAPPPVVDALRGYGRCLGMAFQLVDDLLGIWGDPAVTGKPVLADLRARKKSLPVTYVLSQNGPTGRALTDWYAAPPSPDGDPIDQLERAAELVEAGGGRAWATAEAERHLAHGEELLAGVRLPAAPLTELLELGRFITRRES